MKHKHYEKIVAKASNMDLVVLTKDVIAPVDAPWVAIEMGYLPAFDEHCEYFLCLPQHKDAVLCGLNGGEFQVKCTKDYYSDSWHLNGDKWFGSCVWYMLSNHHSRIKPRKEKRWIAIIDGYAMPKLLDSEQAVNNAKQLMPSAQFVEIEAEV